jgi:hypothetical protein
MKSSVSEPPNKLPGFSFSSALPPPSWVSVSRQLSVVLAVLSQLVGMAGAAASSDGVSSPLPSHSVAYDSQRVRKPVPHGSKVDIFATYADVFAEADEGFFTCRICVRFAEVTLRLVLAAGLACVRVAACSACDRPGLHRAGRPAPRPATTSPATPSG